MASIEKRETSTGTSWRVRLRHAGRRHNLAFVSERDARRWMALAEVNPEQALAALHADADAPPPPTVADMVRAHIDQLTGIEPGTRSAYAGHLSRWIEPHPIGSRLATALTRADVGRWVTWLAEEAPVAGRDDPGLSGKTISNVHGLLSSACKSAVRDGLRADNPCEGIRLPRTSHREREHCLLTPAEVAVLRDAMDEHYQPLLLTLVGTGLRFGEATALRVGDVDLTSGSVRVSRAWKATNGNGRRLGPTKTRRSDRTVAIPANVRAALAPLVAGRAPGEWLFTNRAGRPVTQGTFRRAWEPAVSTLAGDVFVRERHGITITERGTGRRPRVHDLRHTFASWAIQAGVPLPVIQRQLGHESIQTTVDTYGHLARADFDALASRIDVSLGAAQIEG